MASIINENVAFLLADTRLCKSPNLQAFFRSHKGRRMAKHLGWCRENDGLHVIRFEGELWFATLGHLAPGGKENGFAGVSVRKVACYGAKADTGYPTWQKGGDYEDVTQWFWNLYRERGVVSIPEIWHVEIPLPKKHAEMHYV